MPAKRKTRTPSKPARTKQRRPRKKAEQIVEPVAKSHGLDDRTVALNVPGEQLVSFTLSERRNELQRQALRWSYILRNRERWNTSDETRVRQLREMRDFARDQGVTPELARRIADAGMVEVDIPWVAEEQDWELRVFPWEFMLSAVTREYRGGRPLTVVRHLRAARQHNRDASPSTWLQVLSAPGKLARDYDFSGEHELVQTSVASFNGKLNALKDPDEPALQEEIGRLNPHVIHLSGFDSHQGLDLLKPNREAEVLDGYLVRASERAPGERFAADRGVNAIPAERLAQLLNSSTVRKPSLIACNIYNSASRIAPLCVAEGAGAAIGFQDSFDDGLAELFYATLYRAWSLTQWDIVAAFQYAWRAIREHQRPLAGSGIVLWNERSIAGQPAAAADEDSREATIRSRWHEDTEKQTPTPAAIHEQLDVEVELIPQLNYSILHNNGPIFQRFRIRKKTLGVGRVDGIQVNVELFVGTDSYPFRMQAAVGDTDPCIDLHEQIRVSLASALGRAVRESIHTSLFVEVRVKQEVLYCRTHRVTLLPVDEWRYDTDSYRWLPSFVLPRDPAVLRVVDSAQRYLMALRDDATAGFDGYQCVDLRRGARPSPDDCSMVDMQVRALWSALLYESPLSYINPPPSFTDSSQRLRTPTDCVDGKRGTCIDLALLFAACLEYVEIYPAVFLLKTHAFPAYWRHDSYHEDFRAARTGASQSAEDASVTKSQSTPGQAFGWDFRPSQYREILGEVQAGRLVPLETTLVTGRGSFADAIDGGVQNLASRREFESMLDIVLARTDEKTSVTPLPILRGDR
jgi:hypothetical protein